MGWDSAVKKPLRQIARVARNLVQGSNRPSFAPAVIDWDHLVTLDFETYWNDEGYTLSKMTTVEYVRDKRFEAQMVAAKIGKKPSVLVPYTKLKAYLQKIDWSKHDLLCHHTQFDGFILSHHYGIIPRKYYCTLSMARAWLSNDIGASLDDVGKFLDLGGKLDEGNALWNMKNYRAKDMSPEVYRKGGEYCVRDNELCHEIFCKLLPNFSQTEIDLIDLTVQMFCCPVIKLDEVRARKAMEQEIKERDDLLFSIAAQTSSAADLDNAAIRDILEIEAIKGTRAEKDAYYAEARARISNKQAKIYIARKILGSNEQFADLLRAEGADPPYKISPTWMKLSDEEQIEREADKYTYAFAKDDLGFIALMEEADTDRIRDLCEARIAVKSNSNITKAERLLRHAAGNASIPVYYKYAAAHTWRFGGGDKINYQNFTRGGVLRECLYAPRGYILLWADSSQIEVRVNAWLWGQEDLLDDFRLGVDIYSKFGTETIYGRPVSKATPNERHVSKTAILGLGYGMGHEKFRNGLAQGKGGPRVIITEDFAREVVTAYRKKFHRIAAGWKICDKIISDMASGLQGEYKCLRWEKETLWLPNGMRMKYPGLGWDDEAEAWTYTRKGAKVKIYGAKLNENIVQALARIIVAADQMLKVAEEHPVVMTTHDEVVALVKLGRAEPRTLKADDKFNWSTFKPNGDATWAMKKVRDIMRTPPTWAPEIPLDCEAGYAANYS